MNNRVLFVDDEADLLLTVQRALRSRYAVDTAADAAEALALLEKNEPYAVVVADMLMPGMDGVELLTKVAERWPETVRLMMTGDPTRQTALEAVNQGHIYGFLAKPCSTGSLVPALEGALRYHALLAGERELLEKTLHGCVQVLMDILAVVEPRSFGRAQSLKEKTRAILILLQDKSSWECELAASLSEIGCVTVPPGVLQRVRQNEALNAEEREVIQRIPEAGSQLLKKIPRLEGVSNIVLYQNKCFDGSGFPKDGISGEDIPLGARVLKVLLDFNELEARGKSPEQALEVLQERSGAYDPRVLTALSRSLSLADPLHLVSERKTRVVKLKELRPGHVLVNDITTPEGLVLVPAGQKVTLTVLELVRNFGKLGEIRDEIVVEG